VDRRTDRPADVGDAAREKVDAGFTALKMNATAEMRPIDTPATVADAVDRIAAVRESVGDEVDIGVDFHGRVSKPMVRRLAAALEPYDPMFIEEPVLPEHNDALPAIRQSTTTPIATGERILAVGLQGGVRDGRSGPDPAGCLARRRDHRAEEDRVDGRGVRRIGRAALPARADRARVLYPG